MIHTPKDFQGEFFTDHLHLQLYATDASVYRELPLAVAVPKSEEDVIALVQLANQNKLQLTPRATGTSLAGQCVTNGIVVDMSKYFTNILHLDLQQKTVCVQPGLIRDELNAYLKPYGLHFGPNTSTSNRCTIGGMFGNNSSGTTSITYGVTRDKVKQARIVLADASVVSFEALSIEALQQKKKASTLEGKIYRELEALLMDESLQKAIRDNYPHPEIHRRNTGYALDELLHTEVFDSSSSEALNLCKLFAGSEGTLGITTEITLQLDDLPPQEARLIAAQFKSVEASLESVQKLMKFPLFTCELMDHHILDCTKDQSMYKQHRFFLEGDPKAILLLEYRSNSVEDLHQLEKKILQCLGTQTEAYAYPILQGQQIEQAMELRKAGLGLLGNMNGDRKAVACIEDTAVRLEDFSAYIKEFTQLMKELGQEAVYYAHAGAGELHLRPILNLKIREDRLLFEEIATKVAMLVKKYNGALSGEHGDGRVRANFIPVVVGEECYQALIKVKHLFDKNGIFNPGKIVHPKSMLEDLRYKENQNTPEIPSLLQFKKEGGILRAAEKCNGSGDCRKTHHSSGGMCPSFHVTKNEKDTTRGRANVLREVLTNSNHTNQFDSRELVGVFDLCVACKACKTECPSNVDVAAFKAEFLYQYQKTNPISVSAWMVANNARINRYLMFFPRLSNAILSSFVGRITQRLLGFSARRSFPKLANASLQAYVKSKAYEQQQIQNSVESRAKKQFQKVYFFIDEFTNYYDASIGIDALVLLCQLGYDVSFLPHQESGRSFISKGFLDQAKQLATQNIASFSMVEEDAVIVGIEPSALLTFRDEYLRLHENEELAKKVASKVFLVEEFLAVEYQKGSFSSGLFTSETREIKAHVHCHQKALGSIKDTFDMLNIPTNYKVSIISSGCCGMAGSFGYEKKHINISEKMAELSLFPSIKKASPDAIIVANGTSCRHQIKDGIGVEAKHPVTVLREALLSSISIS
jgi:FAD/FMN-containing dehydrogenase/Fe-S oxidoreductase